ncbi:MAG: universal stress protein [Dermatophilaceae bacterium]
MDETRPDGGFNGVVVGVDGSSRDEPTVELAARESALRSWPLLVVHVDESPLPVLDVLAWTPVEAESTAGGLFESARAIAARTDPGVPVRAAAHVGRPENVLRELSTSAGLIVVGTGRKVAAAQFLYGTVSLNIAAHAACPVLVVGEPAAPMPRGRVVVGVDGSRHSRAALRAAAEEAQLRNAELLVHTSWLVEVVEGFVVTEPGSERWRQVEEHHRSVQEQAVADALGETREGLRITHEIVNGPSVDTLVSASKDADLLVVGNRGRGGFLGKLLGSVTMGLLQRSHCPVLVTREH